MARFSIVFAEVTQGRQASAGPRPSLPLVLPQLGPKSRHPNLLGLGPLPPTLDQRQHHLAQVEVVPPHVERWQLHGMQVGVAGGGREGGRGWGPEGRSHRWFSGAERNCTPFYTPQRPSKQRWSLGFKGPTPCP